MKEPETAWLVEIPAPGQPAWWDGRGPNTFTTEPGDVFRMARREDAERALAWKLCVPPPGEVRITEHQWILTLDVPRHDHSPALRCDALDCTVGARIGVGAAPLAEPGLIGHDWEPWPFTTFVPNRCGRYLGGDVNAEWAYCGQPRERHKTPEERRG